MTNVTTLNDYDPDQRRRVDELMYKIFDTVHGEPTEILLAAVAQVVTSLTTFEDTANAYDYVVSHARNEAGYVYIKTTPKPDTVTPFQRPPEEEK